MSDFKFEKVGGVSIHQPSYFFSILVWWLLLIWTYSFSWPQVPDDWKNLILYSGAGVIFFIQLYQKKRSLSFLINPISFCLIFYFITCFLSSLRGLATYEGMIEVSRIFLWIGLAWSLSFLEKKEWLLIARFSTLSAALAALINVFQLRGIQTWDLFLKPFFNANFPPIGHISYFGAFMAAHIPLSILLGVSKKKSQKIFWWGMAVFIFWGLWISGTRSAIVGLGSAFIVSLCLLKRLKLLSWKKFVVVILGTLSLLIIIRWLQPHNLRGDSTSERISLMKKIQDGFNEENMNKLSSSRWSGYISTIYMIRDRPLLGWGTSSFRFIYPEYDKKNSFPGLTNLVSSWYMHPHNEIVNQGAENGLMGLTFFLGFWGSLFFYCWKYLKSISADFENKTWMICAMSGVMILWVTCQFDTNYTFPLTRLMMAFYLGIVINFLRNTISSSIKIKMNPLFLYIIVFATTLFQAAYDYSLYAVQQSKGRVGDDVLFWSRRAFVTAPFAFESLYTFAMAERDFGNREYAEKAMDSLAEHFPQVPMVLFEVARFRLSQGRAWEAKTMLQQAISNAPNFEAAQNLLKTLP
ncbi:MAG: O-antigen ligase family protein [Deltaproteobacteria bacterium]|nr:MAG: O-antigen ligase family protein [Deltaproteobacteria bacterium]